MSAPDLQSAEIRVTERLRAHRKARQAYLAARDLLLEAIAERDTIRNRDESQSLFCVACGHYIPDGCECGQATTCEHGHVACGIGSPLCGDEHQ